MAYVVTPIVGTDGSEDGSTAAAIVCLKSFWEWEDRRLDEEDESGEQRW